MAGMGAEQQWQGFEGTYSIQQEPEPAPLASVTAREIRNAAFWYASFGWEVFPLLKDQKIPATRNGFKDGTCDLDRLDAWFPDIPGEAAYNLGLKTGAPNPDVLDIDNKPGALKAARLLYEAGMLTGAKMRVATQGGGLHLYFEGTGQPNGGKFGRYPIDFRGQGGLVVLPPSTVFGRPYVLLQKRAPTGRTFPRDEAKALLEPPPRPVRKVPPRTGSPGKGDGLRRTIENAPVGQRHTSILWAAARAAEEGLDMSEIEEAALAAGKPQAEVTRLIEWALRKAAQ